MSIVWKQAPEGISSIEGISSPVENGMNTAMLGAARGAVGNITIGGAADATEISASNTPASIAGRETSR